MINNTVRSRDEGSFEIPVKSVITVGAFDGVHRGHQDILARLKAKAKELSATSLVITFWPHPSHVLGSKPLKLINTLDEKKGLIQQSGVDKVIVIPFTLEFSRMDSFTFIKEYLIEQFGMKFFLLGYNHHFGSDRQNDIHVIKEFGIQHGFEAIKADPVEISGEKVSSTKIRHALAEGNIELANSFLGYQFFITGNVGRGQMLGRTIGFPTANIAVGDEHKLIPKDGVYAVRTEINGTMFNGMLNIGHRPTVNKDKLHKTIEVNIFDFDSDIYDEPVSVFFVKRIRDEVKFNGIESLRMQLANDRIRALEILA
ncbi:MAG TPA: riboflavin biosynthesis protein RibF [Bacteroidales bacterium]|nr:riboflavin biosynthesis protein RibF [Bacteroidales bacterium]